MTVVFREAALRALARIRSDDKEAFLRVRRTIAALADQPHPEGTVPWGGTGVLRLHAGNVRVLYEVDHDTPTIYIINVGRIS